MREPMNFSGGEWHKKKLREWTWNDYLDYHNDMVLTEKMESLMVMGIFLTILLIPYWWIKNKIKNIEV